MFPPGSSDLPLQDRMQSSPVLESQPKVIESISKNTKAVTPTTDILQILPEPSKVGRP
jgi:hypothetical protein